MIAQRPGLDDDWSAFAASALGGGLDPQIEALMARAGLLRDRPLEALSLLEQARRAAPSHPAPLIALYRFHFYGSHWAQARAVAEDALAIARSALGPSFGDEPPADEAARHDAAVRFYLFTLKGLAYLNLRLSDLDEARLMLAELRRLDPQDRVGGAVLSHVLARHEQGEAADAAQAYPVRGWSARGPRA